MVWWEWVLMFVGAGFIGWLVSHYWFIRLLKKFNEGLLGMMERCEEEYLSLVNKEPEVRHNKSTYFRGFKACMTELETLLIRLW